MCGFTQDSLLNSTSLLFSEEKPTGYCGASIDKSYMFKPGSGLGGLVYFSTGIQRAGRADDGRTDTKEVVEPCMWSQCVQKVDGGAAL